MIVVHESLVCPEQLNCLVFFRKKNAFLCIWTLSNNDCIIFRSIFSHRGQLRDSNATITEDSNAHWCSRRKNNALRAGAWKLLNRMKMCIFFLFCLNIIYFFWFSTALQKQQKIVICFQEDKWSQIYPDLQAGSQCGLVKCGVHILEWPFIVASLRHTCAIIMLSNQHLDTPHLWGG